MVTKAPIVRAVPRLNPYLAAIPTPVFAAQSDYPKELPKFKNEGGASNGTNKPLNPNNPTSKSAPSLTNRTSPPTAGRGAPTRQNLNQVLDPYGQGSPTIDRGALSNLIDRVNGINSGGGSGGSNSGGYSGGGGGGGGYVQYSSSSPRVVSVAPSLPTRNTPGGTPETYVNGRWVANYNTPKGPDFYNRPIIGPGGGQPATQTPAPPVAGPGQIIDDHGNIVENPTFIGDITNPPAAPGTGGTPGDGSVGSAPVIDWSDPSNPAIYQNGQLIADPVTAQALMRAAAADPANWLDSPIITGPGGYLETNPEAAYTRYMENQLGIQPDDTSLVAQWLRSQYDQSRAQYMAQLAQDPNLLYQTFLNDFGDRADWMNRFNSLTPFQRGVNRLALQAPTRTIADNG